MSEITPAQLREESRKHHEISRRLAEAADALEQLRRPSSDGESTTSSSSSSDPGSEGASSSSESLSYLNRTRIEVVEEVLLETKRPLTREEIQFGTAQKGFPIKAETLASYLSRDERFYQVGRGRWGHAELMGKYKEER